MTSFATFFDLTAFETATSKLSVNCANGTSNADSAAALIALVRPFMASLGPKTGEWSVRLNQKMAEYQKSTASDLQAHNALRAKSAFALIFAHWRALPPQSPAFYPSNAPTFLVLLAIYKYFCINHQSQHEADTLRRMVPH
jgi:hypothetical protein